MRAEASAAVFAATFLLLAAGRIGRRPVPRGPVALLGGLLTAALWRVGPSAIDAQVLLLLAGLMVTAGLAGAAGAFQPFADLLGRRHPGLAMAMACLLVAATSALLLNDAAVVVLVPILLPPLRRMGLPAVPAVVLLACAANAGSVLTPFGNPQNAVLARAGGLGLADFLRVQTPVFALSAALLGLACWQLARTAARARTPSPPASASPADTGAAAVPNAVPAGSRSAEARLVACAAVFAGLAAFAPWGLGTSAALVAAMAGAAFAPELGRRTGREAWRSLDLNVLALFVGLYLLTDPLPRWFPALDPRLLSSLAPAALLVSGVSHVVGNVPATLMLARIDPAWVAGHAPFLVSVTTLGGALLLTGSAASLLAADQARKLGVEVRFWPFARHAAWLLPAWVAGAWWTWGA